VSESDLIFVFAGLGGDTGSHVAPVVADICKKTAGLCISCVALPFSVEGRERRCVADCSLTYMYDASDLTITYPNDHLLKTVPNLPMGKAFSVMNRIMMVPPLELEKAITVGDLEPVRRDFIYARCCRLGVGTGVGEFRELRALDEAFTSPWFDFDMDRVMAAIVTISCEEIEEKMVHNVLGDLEKRIPYAKISYACITDKSLGGKVRVMLLLGVS